MSREPKIFKMYVIANNSNIHSYFLVIFTLCDVRFTFIMSFINKFF